MTASTGPSPQHLEQLAAARAAGSKIRRTMAVASFNGWTTGVLGALTLVCSYSSPSGLLLGIGMCIVAWRELTVGKTLGKLDLDAPRKLAINQCCFAGLLILYAMWGMYTSRNLPGEYADVLKNEPELTSQLGSIQDLTQTVLIWVYVGLILGSIAIQGGTALYYKSREKLIREYVSKTPAWIIEMQRAGTEV